MGWFYGSEYWTYSLPKRIGWDRAVEMTETCLPISARRAKQIGLVDDVLQTTTKTFASDVRAFREPRCHRRDPAQAHGPRDEENGVRALSARHAARNALFR